MVIKKTESQLFFVPLSSPTPRPKTSHLPGGGEPDLENFEAGGSRIGV